MLKNSLKIMSIILTLGDLEYNFLIMNKYDPEDFEDFGLTHKVLAGIRQSRERLMRLTDNGGDVFSVRFRFNDQSAPISYLSNGPFVTTGEILTINGSVVQPQKTMSGKVICPHDIDEPKLIEMVMAQAKADLFMQPGLVGMHRIMIATSAHEKQSSKDTQCVSFTGIALSIQ